MSPHFIYFSSLDDNLDLVGQAIDHCAVIDDFVAKNKDLQKYELQDEDWDAIILIAHWLKAFWSATTQMSTTKWPMLSWIHPIFCGLQDSLTDSLCKLPDNINPKLRVGLVKAHQTLSDYYGKFDELPYYTWALCKSQISFWYMVSYSWHSVGSKELIYWPPCWLQQWYIIEKSPGIAEVTTTTTFLGTLLLCYSTAWYDINNPASLSSSWLSLKIWLHHAIP